MRLKRPNRCALCLEALGFGRDSTPSSGSQMAVEMTSASSSWPSYTGAKILTSRGAVPLLSEMGPCASAMPEGAAGLSPEAEDELFQRAWRLLELATEKEIIRSNIDTMSVVSGTSTTSMDGEEPELSEREESDEEVGMSPPTISIEAAPPMQPSLTATMLATRSQVVAKFQASDPLLEEELVTLFSNLCRRQLPPGAEALRLAWQMREYLRLEASTVVEVPRPKKRLLVVGDLHGHLNDFLHLLHHNGQPSEENVYLFNGDFVDRGVWGPEVVLAVFCIKLLNKEHVFLNRGNHESEMCTKVYGFKSHLQCAFPDCHEELYVLLHEAFDQLPLCHVVGSQVCIVHGGLTREPVCLEDIARLQRGPVPEGDGPAELLFQALLWSDPKEHPGRSDRGIGWHFSPKRTAKFLERSKLKVLIRSHECVDHGYHTSHRGQVITVFSASNYDSNNHACIAVVDHELEVSMGERWKEEYVKPNWVPETMPTGDLNMELRRASSRAWDDDDKRAVAALSNRVGANSQWRRSAKERVLETLRSKIFLLRTVLLESLQLKDRIDNGSKADWFGTISAERWAEVMHSTLKTPAGFPWLDLLPYVAQRDASGQVMYMNFVFRFHNKLSRWLIDQLCADWVAEIADNLDSAPAEIFDTLDVYKLGKLSYSDIRPFFQKHAFGGKEVDTKEALRRRELHFFGLFRTMDTGYPLQGAIYKSEFVLAINRHRTLGAKKCPKGHLLEQGSKSLCGWCTEVHECDACGRNIATNETWRWCDRCQFDLCMQCAGTREADALQVSKRRQAHQRRKSLHWTNVERVLSLLCSTQCDLDSLFGAGEESRKRMVTKDEFVGLATELLPDEEAVVSFYEAVQEYLKEQDDLRREATGVDDGTEEGCWAVQDLLDCLRIVDEAELGVQVERRLSSRGS